MIQNRTRRIWKKCDKRNSHISSELHMICISSNNARHPVTKIVSTLHYTSPNYTSLHFTTLVDTLLFPISTSPHYPLIGLTSSKFPISPFHVTSSYVQVLSRSSRGKHSLRKGVPSNNSHQGRLRLKCDGTRSETRFRLSSKRTSPFESAGDVSSVDHWQPRCALQR